MPIYRVPADQPGVPVSVLSGCNNFLPDTGSEIPIPPFVTLIGSSDNPLVVYQPSTETDWELWRATKNANGTYSACWGGKLDMATSTGVFPYPYGMSATGISYLATAITEADVASGHIDHAIAIQIPRCNEYVYPADRHDCGSEPGQPAEGQWFRLPANLADAWRSNSLCPDGVHRPAALRRRGHRLRRGRHARSGATKRLGGGR